MRYSYISILFALAGCITAPSLPEKPDTEDKDIKQEVVDVWDAETEAEVITDIDIKELDLPLDVPEIIDADVSEIDGEVFIDAEIIFDAEVDVPVDAPDILDADIQDGYDAGDTGPPTIVLKRLSVFSGMVKGESANIKAKGGLGQPSPVNESQNSEGSTASYGFYNW